MTQMKTVGLFEAKQKLSELVERASAGERIGITKRGKLAAMIVPVRKVGQMSKTFENTSIGPSSLQLKN
jgi:prevent-host-death family protein